MTDTAQCQRCGAPVEVGSLFCGSCGVDVTSPDRDETLEVTTGGSPKAAGPSRSTMRQMLREATLGEYEILDELGRGGMATVFRAHDISLDRKVAIKVMAPHLLEGEGMAERFKLEARTAAQLSHPHIIPIYAVRESASILFFVMKYVEGRALDEIIARTGQLPIPMVKDILIKVGGALGYAHRRGVVHRDIKPGNVMIDDEGTPIVTDFGIAKVTESAGLTITGTTIGTPSYMSPEQCEAKEVTGASDQYSLGILAFQMLTARLPFEGDSAVTVMYKHCHEDLPPFEDYRPDCPPDVVETVTRMVAKDPAERWPTMEAAIQRLSIGTSSEAYLDPIRKELVKAAKEGDFERLAELSTGGESVTPVGGGRTTGSGAAATGRRRWLTAALAVLVLAGVGGAIAVMQPWAGDATAGLDGGPVAGEAASGDGVDGVESGGGRLTETGDGGGPGGDAAGGDPGDGAAGGIPGGAGSELGDGAAGDDAAAGTPADAVDEGAAAESDDAPSGGGAPIRRMVADVAISGAPDELRVGETVPLGATAVDRDGNAISDASGFEWTSSAPGVATVSADGTVSARGAGATTISVAVDGRRDDVTLTVLETAASSVSVEPASLQMVVGDREQLSVEVLGPANEPLTGRNVTWTSEARDVASVDADGVVRAEGAGTATVTAAVDGRTDAVDVRVVLDARSAADELVAAYARGVEAGDLAAIRRIYPEIGSQEIDSLERLSEWEDLRVTLVIDAFEPRGDAATAAVRGTYEFDDPATRETRLDVRFTATFRLGTEGWVISSWTPVEGGLF